MKTEKTVWEVWGYDVWGNADDEQGYTVNERYCIDRSLELDAPVTKYNADTPQEFLSASLTDEQIIKALCLRSNLPISVDGDDIHYYVEWEYDGHPCGEMRCLSHDSLSPIRRSLTKLEDTQLGIWQERGEITLTLSSTLSGEEILYLDTEAVENAYIDGFITGKGFILGKVHNTPIIHNQVYELAKERGLL